MNYIHIEYSVFDVANMNNISCYLQIFFLSANISACILCVSSRFTRMFRFSQIVFQLLGDVCGCDSHLFACAQQLTDKHRSTLRTQNAQSNHNYGTEVLANHSSCPMNMSNFLRRSQNFSIVQQIKRLINTLSLVVFFFLLPSIESLGREYYEIVLFLEMQRRPVV